MSLNIFICGVGGQGLVLLTTVIGNACAKRGVKVVTGEMYGLSQRSGAVSVHLRIGEDVFSPLIPYGEADILLSLEAPPFMLRTLLVLLAGSIVAALLNIFYRISYHLAAVTVLVIMSVLTWGQIFLVLWAAIPLIGWAKYYNHDHTLVQIVLGIALAMVVSGATLCLLG